MSGNKPRRSKMSRAEVNRIISIHHRPGLGEAVGPDQIWRKRSERLTAWKDLQHAKLHLVSRRAKRSFRAVAYANEANRMKKLIQSTPAQRASAKEKLKLLLEAKKLPLRTDSLARALTEIGKTDAFADREAACDEEKDMSGKKIERKVKWFVDSRNESPEDVQWHFFRTIANQITQYGGEAKYNCVVYFDEKAFDPRNAYGGHLWYKWGYVRNTGKNPILGLQIMQSDPKVLLQATRAMLKRRRKDPIPIIDIYGKVFYP